MLVSMSAPGARLGALFDYFVLSRQKTSTRISRRLIHTPSRQESLRVGSSLFLAYPC